MNTNVVRQASIALTTLSHTKNTPTQRKPPSPARPLMPSSSASALAGAGGGESELWTDKYAPKGECLRIWK